MMRSLEDRAFAVLTRAWTLLPALKEDAFVTGVTLEDLGAKHGCYDPNTGAIILSTRLFWGSTASEVMTIDFQGDCPAQVEPYSSRALHTAIHEIAHAIGTTTGCDSSTDWLSLSGWEQTVRDRQDTGRYRERRPGWGTYDSAWRYARGAWFPREYASASPYEDFADCLTHLALGWDRMTTSRMARAKFQYLRTQIWREPKGAQLRRLVRQFQDYVTHLGGVA